MLRIKLYPFVVFYQRRRPNVRVIVEKSMLILSNCNLYLPAARVILQKTEIISVLHVSVSYEIHEYDEHFIMVKIDLKIQTGEIYFLYLVEA